MNPMMKVTIQLLQVFILFFHFHSYKSEIQFEVSLKVVDINDEDERRRYEGEHSRMRSTSSSSSSLTQQKSMESNAKPTSLYVSNWTDDEKFKRSKDPMRLNDSQLSER